MLGIQPPNRSGDLETPVSALGTIFVVSQFQHEFVAGLGILSQSESTLGDALAEAEVGEGWCHKMERGTLGPMTGEKREELKHLVKRTGPYRDD